MREILDMQREVKFRVQRSDTKEWLYFSLGDLVGGEVSTIGKGYDYIAQTWSEYTGRHDRHGKEIYEGDVLTREVVGNKRVPANESTSGKEYVQSSKTMFDYVVEWDTEGGAFVVRELAPRFESGKRATAFGSRPIKEGETHYMYLYQATPQFCEIIGDIYSNPELLK